MRTEPSFEWQLIRQISDQLKAQRMIAAEIEKWRRELEQKAAEAIEKLQTYVLAQTLEKSESVPPEDQVNV